MSKESLDYLKLCPNYYTNWEDGCCMENCTYNSLDECPIHYVNGLLEEKDETTKTLEKALELACKEITGSCEYCSYKTRIECPVEANCLDEKINYFKTKAKEMMKSE